MTCEFKYRDYAGAAVFAVIIGIYFGIYCAGRRQAKQRWIGNRARSSINPQTPVDIANETAR